MIIVVIAYCTYYSIRSKKHTHDTAYIVYFPKNYMIGVQNNVKGITHGGYIISIYYELTNHPNQYSDLHFI